MKKILVLHGPNLNLLGTREPEIYGRETLEEINEKIKAYAQQRNCIAECYQSNSEGDLIDKIHSAREGYHGIIINPGAYSHYSLAIMDAIKSILVPVVEVHLSHVFAREKERSTLITAKAACGMVSGFGPASYLLALEGLLYE